jgi:predicted MFS family arabinose efflux permease
MITKTDEPAIIGDPGRASVIGFPVLTARQEWRRHWLLVLAASVGVSFFSFMSPALGLFFDALHGEFGWSRTELSIGMTFGAIITVLGSPFAGLIIDRWGSRRLALPGLVLTALVIAAFGQANGSIMQWIGLWLAFGLLSLAVKTTVWSTAVAGVFSASRGLALGVTLSGTALAQVIVAPLGNWLISTQGWRAAFAWLGLGWGAIAFIFSLLFLFDIHDQRRAAVRNGHVETAKAATLPGLTIREAWRDSSLWRVAIATLLILSITIAVTVHQFPILVEAGLSREQSAWIGSLVGVAGIVGKLVTGWLLDRFHVRWVGGITLASTAVFYPMLIKGNASPILVVVAIMVSGYAAGTKIQICNYLTARYAGIRNYGTIFGFMASMIALAGAVGPLIGGIAYDQAGSYAPLLWTGTLLSLVSGALIFSLGAYPRWDEAPKD